MDQNKKAKIKSRLKRLTHPIAGMILLLHAYASYDSGHSSWFYFAIAGIIFISVAIFHHALEARFRFVDNVFFVLEAIASFVIAYEYLHLHKKGLMSVYILAGLLQLLGIFIYSRNRLKSAKVK